MKCNKLIVSIIVFLILCFLDIMSVNATLPYNSNDWPACVNNGSCFKMCAYENDYNKNNVDHQVGIYVYYSFSEKNTFVGLRWTNVEDIVFGTGSSNIYFISYNNTNLLNLLNEGECPTYAYVKDTGKSSEVCFENVAYDPLNNVSSCNHYHGDKFGGTSQLRYNYYDDYRKDIKIYTYYLGKYDCSSFNSNNNIINSIDKAVEEYFNQYFKKYNGNIPPFLMSDKLNNIVNDQLAQAINGLSQKCQTSIPLIPSLSDAQKQDAISGYVYNSADISTKANAALISIKAKFNTQTITQPGDLFDTNCADFSDTIKIFGIILFILKILLPLIVIVKTIIELMSVVTKGEVDELKKKTNKFLVSIGAAILIFFVPTIVNTIFGLVSDVRGVDAITSDMEICMSCLFDPLSNKCP